LIRLGLVLAGSVINNQIDFAELCKWAKANGYDAIDIPPRREDGFDVARAAGLEPAGSGGVGQLILADDAARDQAVSSAIARLDAIAKAGGKLVMMGHARAVGVDDDAEQLRLAKLGLGPVAAHAEKLGLKLVFENYHGNGRNFMISPRNWRALFEAVPSSALGLCFDPSHLVVLGIDWHRALREFGPRVYYAHAKDTDVNPDGLYQDGYATPFFGRIGAQPGRGWWRYTLPGFGVVDWGRYLGTLREIGFDGLISVEHEDDVWGWREELPRTLEGLKVAERYLRPYLG
jgi:sugar phosphate isomerase/epimerase